MIDNKKALISLVGLGVMLVAIPIVAILAGRNMDIRNRAAIDQPCKICVGRSCNTVGTPPACSHDMDECSSSAACAPTSTPVPRPTNTPVPQPTDIPTPFLPTDTPVPTDRPTPTISQVRCYCGGGVSWSCYNGKTCGATCYSCLAITPTVTLRPTWTPTPTLYNPPCEAPEGNTMRCLENNRFSYIVCSFRSGGDWRWETRTCPADSYCNNNACVPKECYGRNGEISCQGMFNYKVCENGMWSSLRGVPSNKYCSFNQIILKDCIGLNGQYQCLSEDSFRVCQSGVWMSGGCEGRTDTWCNNGRCRGW